MASTKSTLTAERARELLDYDPKTGVLKWRVRKANRLKVGDIAGGSIGKAKYRKIKIDFKSYMEHRVVWLMMTGEWPKDHIDHINGIRNDNRWRNLRVATRSQNAANVGAYRTNTTGFKGVSRAKNRFYAMIRVRGVNHYLGRFDTPEEAHAAYASAAKQYHGEFARTE